MKTAIAIVTLSSLLAACAGMAPQSSSAPQAASVPAATLQTAQSAAAATVATKEGSADGDAPAVDETKDALPQVKLTNEIMYKLLSSELEFQNGQWQIAFIKLKSLAEQTRDPRLAKRAMEVALTAKQVPEGLAAVRLWRSLAPKSEEAAQRFLLLASMQNQFSEVVPVLAMRLREAKPEALPLLLRSSYQEYLGHAKDKAALFAQLEQLFAPYLNYIEARLSLADAAYSKGDAARARSEAQAALDSKPDSEIALISLLYYTEDQGAAQKLVNDFIAKHPKANDVRQSWARLLIEKRQFALAREQFEVLRQDKTREVSALYALGIISLQLKDYPAAEKYFLRYTEVVSNNSPEGVELGRVWLTLSQIAEERGDPQAAMKWLEKIKDTDRGSFFNAVSRRATILAKQGKLEEARQVLQGVNASSDQEKVQLVILEANLLRDANQVLLAFSLLDSALKLYPSNTDLLYDHGMLAEKLERLAVMESSFRKIMQIAPENYHAYNALGFSLANRNVRLTEAHALIEKALKMSPNDAFIMDSMGWVQYRMGKLKEAEATLRRAYEIRPDAEIATHLGEVLWQSGQKEAAQQFWREAQNKDPGSDVLRSTLARLRVSL